MNAYLPALVCFAVAEEAAAFRRLASGTADVRLLVTGMGTHNAVTALKQALEEAPAAFVASCGFAGGLDPDLVTGDILHTGELPPEMAARLGATCARPGKFHCSRRIAVTVSEKTALRRETGADAVEMESQAIAAVCREKNIPCLTLRVILDTARESLPLDFNSLLNDACAIEPAKLALAVARAPWKIPALLRLQRQSRHAAEKLSGCLGAAFQIPASKNIGKKPVAVL